MDIYTGNSLCLWLAVSLPRIDDAGTARLEIALVSGHDVQAMAEGGCGEEAIGCGDDGPFAPSTSRQLAPKLCGVDVDTEESIRELALQSGEPCRETIPLLARGEQGDAFGDFTERDDAQEELSVGNRLERCNHRRIGRRLLQLGDRAGIEEYFHNSTSRIGLLSRSRSSPSREGPDRRKSLKL